MSANALAEMSGVWGWGHFMSDVSEVHIIPNCDDRMHYFENCNCQPCAESGTVVHNSFDGREDFETGKRKLS